MTEPSNKDLIRNATLRALVRHVGLTPQEVAELRLSNLHLAGKSPAVSFTPAGRADPKTITLDLEAHRSLVGWLVARPDSTGDFLFPGEGEQPMDWQDIQQLIATSEQPPATGPQKPAQSPPPPAPKPPMSPGAPPMGSRPMPPLSTPELGAPPPGMAHMPFGPPPPTAPEAAEPVNIPLPTSAPQPPPPRPPRPAQIPISRPLRPEAISPAGAPVNQPKMPPVSKPVPAYSSRPGLPVKKESAPMPPSVKPAGQLAARQTPQPASSKSPRLVMIAVVVIILLGCGACLGGGWFMWQSETGSELLAGLGLSELIAGRLPNDKAILASLTPPPTTPRPTSTLPPTSTPTLLPATHTPLPTETAPPAPTDTPVPSTDTPAPVDNTPTPVPTETPTLAAPAETPTPTEPPTPAMKYPAPVLVEPANGFKFIGGNLLVLRWKSVGELASNEQYAVRLVYNFQNKTTYQGTNTREPEWAVPPSLYRQIDGPDNRYEWFVAVERLNEDGSGTAISPESERRSFTWK